MNRFTKEFADEAATASCGDYAEPNAHRAEFRALAEQARRLSAEFSALLVSSREACVIFNANSVLGDAGDITATLADIEGDFNRAADAQEE